jgi:hypothetical protein
MILAESLANSCQVQSPLGLGLGPGLGRGRGPGPPLPEPVAAKEGSTGRVKMAGVTYRAFLITSRRVDGVSDIIHLSFIRWAVKHV